MLIEREIREGLGSKMEGKHIALEAVLIRNVELPDAIRHAIGQKLAVEQDVLKMKYVIEVAQAVAQQRRSEAQGVADYNQIVSASPDVADFGVRSYPRAQPSGGVEQRQDSGDRTRCGWHAGTPLNAHLGFALRNFLACENGPSGILSLRSGIIPE